MPPILKSVALPERQALPTAAERTRKSSFYAALRILPRAQREAMFEIYSFCRAVDDIADEGGSRPSRSAELDLWRQDIAAIYQGRRPQTHLLDLARTIAEFNLPEADFQSVIDGMAMDVEADIKAPSMAELDLYCDRVASAVGRLSVRIFGVPSLLGSGLAHHLGRALQLTNILRDLDEDAAIGRLYLPREALEEAGIRANIPMGVITHPALGRACAPLIARAQAHFQEANAIMVRAPRRSVRAPAIMASVYGLILRKLVERGFNPPREKIRVPRYRIILAAVRYCLI